MIEINGASEWGALADLEGDELDRLTSHLETQRRSHATRATSRPHTSAAGDGATWRHILDN